MHNEKNGGKIRLVLIDKHKLLREGIRNVLESYPIIDVIAEGETKNDAVRLTKQHHPHVILIDVHVIAENELKTIKKILKYAEDTKVIVLSEQDDDNFMVDALKMGARGYFIKEMNPDTFIHAIKAVKNGKYWYHPSVTHYLIQNYFHLIQEMVGKQNLNEGELESSHPLHVFTPREFEVLQLLGKGYSNKVIAEKLNITNYTVSSHVRNILKKSNVNDRTHAVVKAVENGWINIQRK